MLATVLGRWWRKRRGEPSAGAGAAAFWASPAAELLAELESSVQGLASTQVASRLEACRAQRMKASHRPKNLVLLLRQFANPLILLLVVAAGIALAVGEAHDALLILVIVAASGLLGFFQEASASDAVARLLALVAVRTRVLRDGQTVERVADEVVPGDVVLLEAGSLVPGDCRILESKDLYVDEAALTGETFPAEKKPGREPADSPLARRSSALFLGTHVVSGTAKALVVRVGRATELGRLSAELDRRAPETEFERGLERFGGLLVRWTALLVLAVFAFNVFAHRPGLESFLFALALAVGLVPELLPAIVAVNLARGARRMARARVIVKRLPAIENFGSMTILCSDKTGTLTEGKVRLASALDAAGQASERVLFHAFLNASFESGFANPIDRALCEQGRFDLKGWTKLDEVPYDFVRKRLSVLVEHRGEGSSERWLVTKGAVSAVLAVSSQVEFADGSSQPLAELRAELEARARELGASGLRTLGLALRRLDGETVSATRELEREMSFLGFVTFFDPPKAGIEATLAELRAAGVAFKLITGDQLAVAERLAREVGVAQPATLTGGELRELSLDALVRRAPEVDVFAEVEPNQKERILVALSRAGHVVGFLGDGINDAPALHAADVGISVEGAVDVAKEAADLVLLERDLSVLTEGVMEGRRTFANTLKYVLITTSANFGNMLSMAGASAFLPFLPLLPTQILLNNFLSDIPAIAISTDRVDPELTARPRRWNVRFLRDFLLLFGGISSVFDFLTFGALLWLLKASPEQFRTGWFIESVLTELLILLVIRTARPFWQSRTSPAIVWATAATCLASVLAPYLPGAQELGFVPLPLPFLGLLLAITLAYVATTELAKGWFFRREGWG